MKMKKAFLILLSLILMATMSLLPLSAAQACGKNSKPRRHPTSMKVVGKLKTKSLKAHKLKLKKKLKKTKHAKTLPAKIVPPSRVRIIDTASKADSNHFPMPEINEWRASQPGSSELSSQSPDVETEDLTLE